MYRNQYKQRKSVWEEFQGKCPDSVQIVSWHFQALSDTFFESNTTGNPEEAISSLHSTWTTLLFFQFLRAILHLAGCDKGVTSNDELSPLWAWKLSAAVFSCARNATSLLSVSWVSCTALSPHTTKEEKREGASHYTSLAAYDLFADRMGLCQHEYLSGRWWSPTYRLPG